MDKQLYAEILPPQKIGIGKNTLTYAIPVGTDIKIGQIVQIPLRNTKIKGVVHKISDTKPPFNTKNIEGLISNAPHLSTWQIELIDFISDYYFAPLFKVLKLFIPGSLIKKKTIKAAEITMPEEKMEIKFKHELNNEQKDALLKIESSTKRVALLRGITGSGKTEVYLNLLEKVIKEGGQALFLIPEISLTTQMRRKFQKFFQEEIAVIHSQLTPKQKETAWKKIHDQQVKIVIGSRSALFAPFKNLKYIVIDEEHDTCYKQDQSPRYNAITVAKKMAELLDIKVLLGSATPSLESYKKALTGEYELIEIEKRAGRKNQQLPATQIIDLRTELKAKNFSIFSLALQHQIQEKLNKNEQIMLFLNRRGAASAVICRICGHVVKCENCEIPLTYHKKITIENSIYNAERLICHHCGIIKHIPTKCPACASPFIKYIGLGTQKIEEEVNKMFPTARHLRADRDTVGSKDGFSKIYESFRNHEADILIGTQMIAFGLHLPKVSLVGVILADMGLTLPDYRSAEQTFQLITQVAGRSGRGDTQGNVIIQTYLPNHYAIETAAKHDYKAFYQQEIKIREQLGYPPFNKLIKLTATNENSQKCENEIQKIYKQLQQLKQPDEKINCYPALIHKLNNKYRWHILICGEKPAETLRKINIDNLIVDVDPINTI